MIEPNKAPDEPATQELYRDREGYEDFVAWWRVRNPVRVQFKSLDAIPGHGCASRRGASHVFGHSQVAFAYWDFDGASLDALAENAAVVNPNVTNRERPSRAVARPASILSAANAGIEQWPQPELPVYGVDFSGGEEDSRYGNRKIWIAAWLPGKDVTLRCGRPDGTADKICRRDLPALIQREPGWWSLDFPFGIAKETARALKLKSWPEWLRWCAREGDATTLRDKARESTTREGVAWAQSRQVDESNQTTWFPLFEQLYRQTIFGAREVLLPLYNAGFCIMPWGWTTLKEPPVIVEGFPGAVVRDHLIKRRVSYKGRTGAHKSAREAIINALRSVPFTIPIRDDVAAKASEDQDGDALDALVLLLGSWISQRLSADEWKQQIARLDGCGATVEGWFPG